jgi:hypothetical protein
MDFILSEDEQFNNLLNNIKVIFPKVVFKTEYLNTPYVAISAFITYIFIQLVNKNSVEIEKIFSHIESLYESNSINVRQFATIGILEGIQNNELFSSYKEEIKYLLMPETKKCFDQLNRFWNGEINHLSEN